MKYLAGVSLYLTSAFVIAGEIGGGPVNGVPEPGIWGLLGVAGVALVVARFFNKKK